MANACSQPSQNVQHSRLQIICRHELATLERLLRVVRFRGFSVQSMQSELDLQQQKVTIDITVYSERPVSLLSEQLRKNYEVIQVTEISQSEDSKKTSLNYMELNT